MRAAAKSSRRKAKKVSVAAKRRKRILRAVAAVMGTILLAGFLVPENLMIPVEGATERDWNHETFWYEPWGKSGVHKGIDIFAPAGRPVISATNGMVVFKGRLDAGGNVVILLGLKWRLHYYAHLREVSANVGSVVLSGHPIGEVGDSGNAKGKPPHLHYSVKTLVPYPWRCDESSQGWKKMFYLDPGELLLKR